MFNKTILVFILALIGYIYLPLIEGNEGKLEIDSIELYEAQSVYGDNIGKLGLIPLHFRLKEYVFKQNIGHYVLPGDLFYIVHEHKESLPNNSYRIHVDVLSAFDNTTHTFISEIITQEAYHKIVSIEINEYQKKTNNRINDTLYYTDKQYILTLEDGTVLLFAGCVFRNPDLYMKYPDINVGDYVSLSNFCYAEEQWDPNYEPWIWYRKSSPRTEEVYNNLYEVRGVYNSIQFYQKNNEGMSCYFNQPISGDFFILSRGPRSIEEHLITSKVLNTSLARKVVYDAKRDFFDNEQSNHEPVDSNVYTAESVYGSYVPELDLIPMHFRLNKYVFKQNAVSCVLPEDQFQIIKEHKESLPNNSYRIHLDVISLPDNIPHNFVSEIITQEPCHKIVDIKARESQKVESIYDDRTSWDENPWYNYRFKQWILTLEDGTVLEFCQNFLPGKYFRHYREKQHPNISIGDYVSLSNFCYAEEQWHPSFEPSIWYKKSIFESDEKVYSNLYEIRGVYNSIQFYRKKDEEMSCYFNQSAKNGGDYFIYSHGPKSHAEHQVTSHGLNAILHPIVIYDEKPE